MEAALRQLKIPSLREWQKEPIGTILEGRDVLVVQSTGSGKSLLYQLPAIMDRDGITIVFSPLIALQRDQVQALTKKGVRAVLLNSNLEKAERRRILHEISGYQLLYIAPEQLKKDDLPAALKNCHVNRVVVDEAHILPEAEREFRPYYGKIGKFIDSLPERPQVIACTATATRKMIKEIRKSLHMVEVREFSYRVRRENLKLSIKHVKGRGEKGEQNMFRVVESSLMGWDGKGSAIIYCPTVKRVDALCKWLKGRGFKAAKYTGKMKKEKRNETQNKFLSGEVKIVVATNAFGLGVDKPDVRVIIHAGMPLSLTGYTQEIGRAGRDGKKSKCILFYTDSDRNLNKRILSNVPSKDAMEELDAIWDLVHSDKCVWKIIERHFNNKEGKACGDCSNCKAKKNM